MSSVNKVIILGRVGKDPEVREVSSGVKVANFSIATSEKWKDKTTGEQKEQTEWHNCQAWRGLAEVIGKYVKKGDMIYVDGKMKTRKYEKDGVTHYATDIIVDNMTMCGGKREGGGTASSGSSGTPPEDDLPF
jgi:single-strand DNA-binding protein